MDGCCDCTMGGKQKTILKDQYEAYLEQQKIDCAETLCPMMISEDSSCREGTQAQCIQGACVFSVK